MSLTIALRVGKEPANELTSFQALVVQSQGSQIDAPGEGGVPSCSEVVFEH